ncbi:MCE family protein [Nocardioides caeni]|uniref:MCE family protein n=1 Tax=Nocardioides caeni TaxID=574700 RepID=A0A4S8NPU5_9ACTN|nr:MlaD family protein [Nocardioides caeni]THV18232.1 MCE family protein [Nocardioides caeni]
MSRQLSELARNKGAVIGVAVFALVAVVLTSMVAGTLSRAQRGDTIAVTAVFRDATGLRPGDDVRMAGVRIGRVAETRVGTGDDQGLAIVTMNIDGNQGLHDDIIASIDYLNLMGQRYVAITRPDRTQEAGALEDGAEVPLARTRTALDLTAMFNAFQPIFDLLRPSDVNELATNIVQVLQGQGPTLDHLLRQTADLTSGLVDREDVFARVVDNVTLVLDTTNEHRAEVTAMVDGLASLTEGLANDRDRIATSLDSIARLTDTTADIVGEAAPEVQAVTAQSQAWFRYLATRADLLADTGAALPQQLKVYLRTLGYGSYLNVYVCTNIARVKGVPLGIDLGVAGDKHSKRCR